MRRDLRSDLFYFLVVIQLVNTWLKKKKKNSASVCICKSERISVYGIVLVSKSEVCFIGSLHKRCYIAPQTNKREVSTNLAKYKSTRVVHKLMSLCSHDQI